jgi:hypothetical protein
MLKEQWRSACKLSKICSFQNLNSIIMYISAFPVKQWIGLKINCNYKNKRVPFGRTIQNERPSSGTIDIIITDSAD